MVFRRRGARTYAFQARLPNGRYQQLQTGAPFTAGGKGLASRIEAMWQALALDPNEESSLNWLLTLANAKGGQQAMIAAYVRAAALPGSWRTATMSRGPSSRRCRATTGGHGSTGARK